MTAKVETAFKKKLNKRGMKKKNIRSELQAKAKNSKVFCITCHQISNIKIFIQKSAPTIEISSIQRVFKLNSYEKKRYSVS